MANQNQGPSEEAPIVRLRHKCAGCGLVFVEHEDWRCPRCQSSFAAAIPKEYVLTSDKPPEITLTKQTLCPKCGRAMSPFSRFCSSCGTPNPNYQKPLYQPYPMRD